MANENDLEWFTPGKSCKKCDTKPFSGFDLLHFYESVFPLIRESLSEAIKRKLSNRDYKMEKMRCHVYKTSNPSMLSEKLYFDLQRQPPFQCIFEGKTSIFLFVSGFYLQA
jgi:hypothetical protein